MRVRADSTDENKKTHEQEPAPQTAQMKRRSNTKRGGEERGDMPACDQEPAPQGPAPPWGSGGAPLLHPPRSDSDLVFVPPSPLHAASFSLALALALALALSHLLSHSHSHALSLSLSPFLSRAQFPCLSHHPTPLSLSLSLSDSPPPLPPSRPLPAWRRRSFSRTSRRP